MIQVNNFYWKSPVFLYYIRLMLEAYRGVPVQVLLFLEQLRKKKVGLAGCERGPD